MLTYQEAVKLAKQNPDHTYPIKTEGAVKAAIIWYCSKRKKIVSQMTKDGQIWF